MYGEKYQKSVNSNKKKQNKFRYNNNKLWLKIYKN